MQSLKDITSESALSEAKRVWGSLNPEAVLSHARQRWPDGEAERAAAKLLRQSSFDMTTGCANWGALLNTNGYGRMSIGPKGTRREWYTHRLAWFLFRGPIAEYVLHKCDNPRCVNPAHLFEGDDAINSEDKVNKGRHAFGTRMPHARLTDELVLEMRRIYRPRVVGVRRVELAKRYGISLKLVSLILDYKRWRHLPRCIWTRPYKSVNAPANASECAP